jgi:hypothetical protein
MAGGDFSMVVVKGRRKWEGRRASVRVQKRTGVARACAGSGHQFLMQVLPC